MVFDSTPIRAAVVFALLAGASFAYGRFFLRITGFANGLHSSLTLEFLCGYLLLNTTLFVLTLASPLGMTAHLWILAAAALPRGLRLAGGRHRQRAPRRGYRRSLHWFSAPWQ